MFANLNIYVVIRKYEPTIFYCCAVKFFQTKKIRADTSHTRYQPLGIILFLLYNITMSKDKASREQSVKLAWTLCRGEAYLIQRSSFYQIAIIQFMHFYIPSSQLLDSEIYRHIAFHVYKLALLFSWLPRRHSLHHTHSLFVEHSMA